MNDREINGTPFAGEPRRRIAELLGETGVGAFDRLGVGTAQFGNLGQATTEEQVDAVMESAWEAGLRYFDTAPHYGLGLSERRLGQRLGDLPREEYILSTKVGRLLRPHPWPTETDLDNGFAVAGDLYRERDYTGAGMRRSLEESLKRLGLDRVDILWIHDPEETEDQTDIALASGAPELERMRQEGLFSAWGVGSKDAAVLRRFVDESTPDLLMVSGRHTLLEQDQVGLMGRCLDQGVGVVAVSVFNSGVLASPWPKDGVWYEYGPAPREVLERARTLARIAEGYGIDLPTAALQFPLRHPAVVNVTVGMRTADHVTSNLHRAGTAVPEAFWDQLHRDGLLPRRRLSTLPITPSTTTEENHA